MSEEIGLSRLCLVAGSRAVIMSQSAPNTYESSLSFVLSLGEYLCLQAKLYPEAVYLGKKDKSLQAPYFYYQLWCDLLGSLVFEDSIMHVGKQVTLVASVSPSFIDYAGKSGHFMEVVGWEKEQNIKDAVARSIFKLEKSPVFAGERKEVIIINLSWAVTYEDKVQPKVNIDGLFAGIFSRFGDRWRSFKILLDQIPTVEQLVAADTILISGSSLCVLDMPPSIKKLEGNLMKALEVNKQLKVLGFCFGHQMLAQAFGAKVEKRHVSSGLEFVEAPRAHGLGKVPFFEGLGNGESYKVKVYEYHSDFVVSVPENMVCVGSSQSSECEAFLSLDKRIFTFQFHPEYMIEYIRNIMKRWQHEGFVFKGTKAGGGEVDQEHHQTCTSFRRTVRRFMEWRAE